MSDEGESDFGIGLPEPLSPEEIPEGGYDHLERPPRAKFLPWHRPRKHYVRNAQWANAIREVMRDRDGSERLKYVGLPGVDLLDLRHILKFVCEPHERHLEFIGF